MLITAGTFMSVCFTIPQIMTWKRNHLHPLGVLLMSVFATAYFLATFILGIIFLAIGEYAYDERESGFQATLILDTFAA
jgi:heme/copper-type cytochrome/quinol oxidase subunit 3